jgi:predicted DNA-binding transcriptional regulator YafY
MADLIKSGVPLEGEAGIGYMMRNGFDLPPLMFTEEEIAAISLGADMVSNWTDESMSVAAKQVMQKVESVLPERLKPRIQKLNMFAPNFKPSRQIQQNMARLRPAINNSVKIKMEYKRGDGAISRRTLRPLCLAFIAPHWLLTGWCELRRDFRNFRLDRIISLETLTTRFREEPGKSLEDFLQTHTREKNGPDND